MLRKTTLKKPKIITWLGEHPSVQNYVSNIRRMDFDGTLCDIHYKGCKIEDVYIPTPYKPFMQTALTAAAIGYDFGLTADEIKEGIKSYKSEGPRAQVIKCKEDVYILSDCYDGKQIISNLSLLSEQKGRKVVFFGGLSGLAHVEEERHSQIIDHAVACGIDVFIYIYDRGYVNNYSEVMIEKNNKRIELLCIDDRKKLIEMLPTLIKHKDTILVSGLHNYNVKFSEVTQMIVDYLN